MWVLDDTRIFVQEFNPTSKQIIARLQPVDGGTRLQIFGHETEILKLSAYIVGFDDKNALELMTGDGVEHFLVTPYSVSGWYYVNSVDFKISRSVCQTLRPDLAEDSPVFIANIELYYDEY